MASIFRKDDNFVETPNRNTYDMSFQNNLTLDIGSLRPCFCQPVMPGDSWSIESVHGLRFMPLTYPIQTRMKSSIHFFYVRNRNLWKDWPDFIGKTKEGLVPPYIHLTEQNRKLVETGQLGDFLGVPTRIYGQNAFSGNYELSQHGNLTNNKEYQYMLHEQFTTSSPYSSGNINDVMLFSDTLPSDGFVSFGAAVDGSKFHENVIENGVLKYCDLTITASKTDDFNGTEYNDFYRFIITQQDGTIVEGGFIDWTSRNEPYAWPKDLSIRLLVQQGDTELIESDKVYYFYIIPPFYSPTSASIENTFANLNIRLSVGKAVDGLDVSELELSRLPWRSDENLNGIPLSALPFRAYESIYNAFYRNAENNPLLINGVPEYNKWIRTNEGGADTNFYPIMYHNWEDDFLTTAVPSPQQGNAPLVGLSGTPTLTVAHDDGTTTQMQLDVNDEGLVTAVSAVSGDAATTSALMEAVSYGIAINDLRNVNSFQRWLENNIRRGYKYKDQIKTHYGVSVRYDELDMPEFIGGISEPVMVNQISQTVATEEGALGDMAGQASVFGQSKNITHYCDEHGFIIGIICIKPAANYSQLLPKYFNVTDTFDYYFPEFGHIGMQPITYAEVTPLQAHLEGKLNDVFGYQRAWYDLISKTDEVHGLFRDNLRNFLINRTFDGVPELGKEFTVIDPDQINDVFAYTENTDKILGQVFFKCSKKTPIPLYGIPKLE